MRKFVLISVTVLCSVACGDDGAEPRKPARDAGPRRDAGEPHDAAADSGGGDAATDAAKPLDAGSPGQALPGKTVTIRFKAAVNGEPFDCSRRYVLPNLGRVEPREFKVYVQDL